MFMIRALRGETKGAESRRRSIMFLGLARCRGLDFNNKSTGCFEKNVQQYIINPNYSTPNYKPMGQDLVINLDAFINKTAVRPECLAAARGTHAGGA